MTKRKSKGAYMISSVAEMYGIHPQTLRLYEREGLSNLLALKATLACTPTKTCCGWNLFCRWLTTWA